MMNRIEKKTCPRNPIDSQNCSVPIVPPPVNGIQDAQDTTTLYTRVPVAEFRLFFGSTAPERRPVTEGTRREYAEVLRLRYRIADKREPFNASRGEREWIQI
jgi:hypothetical protein